MLPYYLLLGIPFAVSLLTGFSTFPLRRKTHAVFDSFFLIWLFLLFFRAERVGCDLPVYKYHFFNYAQFSLGQILVGAFSGEFELGYALIVKLISCITANFRFVMIVCALIAVLPVWKFYRNEQHPALLIILFVNIAPFSMYFSGLRQAMAMAFTCLALHYCRQKDFLRFVLVVFAAFLFHRSALIMLLMYPVYHFKLKKKVHLLFILPFIGFIYVFNKPIFRFLLLFMQGKYYDRYAEGVHSTGAYSVLLLLAVLLVFTYLLPDQCMLDPDTIGLRNILTLAVLLQTFAGVHSLAMRMNYYYLLLVPLAISHVIDRSEKNQRLAKISILCMTVFFFVYFFYHAYTSSDILNIFPYVSVFHT